MKSGDRLFGAASVLALCLVLLSAGAAFGGASIGAFGGLARFKLGGDTPEGGSYKAASGVNIGVLCDIAVNDHFWIGLHPSYIRKGTTVAFKVEGFDEKVDSIDVKLDYLAFPVVGKVAARGGRFFISGGIEYAYLMKGTAKTSAEEQRIEEEFRRHDLAARFGAGLFIPRDRTRFFIEIVYSQSIFNIVEGEDGPAGGGLGVRIKNGGLLLNAGILYDL